MSLYDEVLARRDYVSDIRMVIDSNIVEYDIEKANLNILYKYGKIDYKTYDMVYHMDRYNRQYFMGNFIRDNHLSSTLAEGIKKAKLAFLEKNEVPLVSLLEIRNDALFIINPSILYPELDGITFKAKSIYYDYLELNNMSIFFTRDMLMTYFEVKGMPNRVVDLHIPYLLKSFDNIINIYKRDKRNAIKQLHGLYNDYIERKLDIGYYRPFNIFSQYEFRTSCSQFNLNYVPEQYKNAIDISFNERILREFHSLLLQDTL